VPRDGSFTRNVTIGGTLTYEDVTNIDSVGLVTARNGIEIGARPGVAASISVDGNMIVSGISTFGGALSGTTGTFSGAVSGSTGTFTGDVDIADKIVHTGDTDTAIRFPSANTVTVETNGSESTRFDSGGRLLIGTSSIVHSGAQKVQIAHTDANAALTINRYSNNSNPPYLYFQKSRSGTIGGNTVVQDGDLLGRIYFTGNGGDGMYTAAYITSSVDGTPGANDMPGRLGLWTSPNSTDSPVERLRIDQTGRVIIGDSMSSVGSSSKLQVREDGSGANLELVRSYNSASTPARLRFANSRGTAGSPLIVADDDTIGEIRFHGYDGTDYNPIAASIFAVVDGTPGSNDMPGRLEFHTTPDGNQATVERMRIDSDGRVLIGDTTTGNAFSGGDSLVIGNTSSNTRSGITLVSANDQDGGIYFSDGTSSGSANVQGQLVYDHNGTGMKIYTTASERMRIGSDGKVYIGTTSGSGEFLNIVAPQSSSSYSVSLYSGYGSGITGSYAARIDCHGFYTNSYSHGGIQFKNNDDISHNRAARAVLFMNNNGATVGTVNFGTSSTSYNTSSDYRLKENQVTISDGITRLKTLKPYRFNFKDVPSETIDGFFAHEVTAVPNAVDGTKDGVDANGDPEYQTIDHSKLVPLLTAALQEAVTEIESLKSRLDTAGL